MQSLKAAAGHKAVGYFPHLSLKAMQADAQQQRLPPTPDIWLLIIILLRWLSCFIEGRLFRRLVFIFNVHILRNKCLYYCSFSVTVGRVQRSNPDIKHAQRWMCQCWAGPAPPQHPHRVWAYTRQPFTKRSLCLHCITFDLFLKTFVQVLFLRKVTLVKSG